MTQPRTFSVLILCLAGCFSSPEVAESAGSTTVAATGTTDMSQDDTSGTLASTSSSSEDSGSSGDGSSGGASTGSTGVEVTGSDSTGTRPQNRDCPEDPCMVTIDAGTFVRGTSKPTVGNEHEAPSSEIYLDAFEIDRFEVTAQSYDACVARGECSVRGATVGRPTECTTEPEHPANCVLWQQAMDYCESVGKRLPTEAQWERAARGTQGARFPWGDAAPTCSEAFFGVDQSTDPPTACEGGTPTAPVGSRSPAGDSPDGVTDMAGNVFEWVADYYAADAYATGPSENPVGPEQGEARLIRGGFYLSPPRDIRAAYRQPLDPATASPAVGFRCARSVP